MVNNGADLTISIKHFSLISLIQILQSLSSCQYDKAKKYPESMRDHNNTRDVIKYDFFDDLVL